MRLAYRITALLAGLVAFAACRDARACGEAGRPWVSVAFSAPGWPEGFAERVLGDLRAGLKNRGIETCGDADPAVGAPIATVRVTSSSGKSVVVAVEIRDALTEKRVSRDIDLARVPEDGRAFAVAIAVDELVWASWAEIALTGHRERAPRAAPPEVVRGVERAMPRRDTPSLRLGALFVASRYGGGQRELGADASFVFPLPARLGLGVALGLRQGREVDASHGRVQESALGLGADLRFLPLRTQRVELGLSLGPRASLVRFSGRADAAARGSELTGLVLFARAKVIAGVRLLGPLWLEAGFGAGAPLRALEATDAGQVVSGVSGLELTASGGLLVDL